MAKKKAGTGYWQANQSFATVLDGENVFVRKGEFVRDGHPLLDGREEMFEPAESFGRFDVEEATAKPGASRGDADAEETPEE